MAVTVANPLVLETLASALRQAERHRVPEDGDWCVDQCPNCGATARAQEPIPHAPDCSLVSALALVVAPGDPPTINIDGLGPIPVASQEDADHAAFVFSRAPDLANDLADERRSLVALAWRGGWSLPLDFFPDLMVWRALHPGLVEGRGVLTVEKVAAMAGDTWEGGEKLARFGLRREWALGGPVTPAVVRGVYQDRAGRD